MLKRMARNFSLSVFALNCFIIVVVFGGALNFGFITDTWFSPIWGDSGLGIAASVVVGVILGLCEYGLYLDSENAWRTIWRKDGWERAFRLSGLVILNLILVGVNIVGLYLRLSFLNSRGVGFLGVAGILLECAPPIVGLVINPLVHPDLDVLEEQRINRVGRTTLDEVYDEVEDLPANDRFGALYGDDDLTELLDETASNMKQLEAPKKAPKLTPLSSRFKEKHSGDLRVTKRRISKEQQPITLPPTGEEAEEEFLPFTTELQRKTQR